MSAVAVVAPWEIHSELVLVSPEVCERARELLPLREPEAFLARRPHVAPDSEPEREPGLPAALVGYTVLRVAETTRTALLVTAFVVALALIAQISH
jgi:hypothetical protein